MALDVPNWYITKVTRTRVPTAKLFFAVLVLLLLLSESLSSFNGEFLSPPYFCSSLARSCAEWAKRAFASVPGTLGMANLRRDWRERGEREEREGREGREEREEREERERREGRESSVVCLLHALMCVQ